jgi:hypothetical protein
MGYDPRTVYRIHGKALKEFEKVKDVSKCQWMSVGMCVIVYGVKV